MPPVVLALAADDGLRASLEDVLRRRFEPDYRIEVTAHAADARRRLGEWGDAGERVALVIAPVRGPETDGIPFLAESRTIHPGAGRVLVVDVGDVSAAPEVNQALTLGHVDAYFGTPWASPEEELYPVLGEALRQWALEHEPRYEKAVVIDAPGSSQGRGLSRWLDRNGVTTTFLTSDDDRAAALLTEHAADPGLLPVAILYDGRVLVQPARDELAESLGAPTRPTRPRYDVVIVGSGPAGLAAALYAGSEGLSAVVVEQEAIGGQAGASAKIRNYLGFPWGVRGGELTQLAGRQAEQLGAEFIVARDAVGLRPEGDDRIVTLSNGDEVRAGAVVIAAGVSYRRLGVPAVDSLVGSGVFYGAGASEARSMGGLDVYVLGAGNSAGQAAVHLAEAGARVTVLVRRDSLGTSMSDYLQKELAASPHVTIRYSTEVVGAGSADQLEHLELADRASGAATTVPADALFVFIGAQPHSEWLDGAVAADDSGFVLTGRDLAEHAPEAWTEDRVPAMLETSLPAVFAAGDIRHGSIKRVAAAVGEGSTAAMLVLAQLANR